jgi:carboxyl-terminal processing protease
MELIRSNYVDAERADYESLIRGALEGMVRTLDENSQFLDSDAASRFLEDAAGEFAGLGLVVAMRDERLVIIAPMDDTPAFRAGLLPGDHILEIDGETTEGLSLDAAVTRMRGTQGSKVRLRVQRVGRTAPDQVDLVRDAIPVTSVRASMPDPDGIGYIRILQFSENTADSLLSNLERLEKGNLRALILDLRNNPGGLLQSAVEVSQLFLPSGKLIVSTEGRESPVRAVSHPTTRSRDYPLAILVNEGSASASEIVAGALQDHGRAVLVGRKTFGKGSVQSVLPVSGGSVLKLTTAWYYTPSRRRIHGFGIEPDIVVSMPPEELFAIFSVQEETVDSVGVRIEADVQRVRAADALRGVLRLHGRGDTGRAGAIGRVSAITQRIKASFPPASSQWTTQGHSYG